MGKAERKTKNAAQASAMKARKEERTVQRCPVCYKMVSCDCADGRQSRYNHKCQIGAIFLAVATAMALLAGCL